MDFDITNMLNPDVYDHPVTNIELIETHISWVILTGEFAYKIKKPVNFGFLDFSTLEKRRAYCERELELNSRLAGRTYLEVVAIGGTHEKPKITDQGKAIEYAVKMQQFPQSAQLDHKLAAGQLGIDKMETIAAMVADFHNNIPVADAQTDYGNSTAVYAPVEENFRQIEDHLDTREYAEALDDLKLWSAAAFKKLTTVFEQRRADGFVRECHGDMHLRNIVWLDDGPTAFDCIEFNSQLRWIDTISEVAFFIMDLQDRKQAQLANRFLNTYLEITGDYSGLAVLPFYLCYRAVVRAKVAALRLEQKNIKPQERAQVLFEFESYLKLASRYTQPTKPKIILMRGVSASGKSALSKQLVDAMSAIRIRSDVERKRLFRITVTDNAASEINAGVYSAQASQQAYAKLLELTEQIVEAGYSVIVDAAFLKHEQRRPFEGLAQRLNKTCIILEVTAPVDVLKKRIVARKNDASDADLAVLENQLSNWQALQADEVAYAIFLNNEEVTDISTVVGKINRDD